MNIGYEKDIIKFLKTHPQGKYTVVFLEDGTILPLDKPTKDKIFNTDMIEQMCVGMKQSIYDDISMYISIDRGFNIIEPIAGDEIVVWAKTEVETLINNSVTMTPQEVSNETDRIITYVREALDESFNS